MGFFDWLLAQSGSHNEEEKQKKVVSEEKSTEEESSKNKDDKKQQKNIKAIPPKKEDSEPVKTSQSYLDDPDQYNTSRLDNSQNNYNLQTTNIGNYGCGTKNVQVFTPHAYDDVRDVIMYLRGGDSVMINLNKIESDAQRFMDCVFGASYALSGHIKRIDANIFLITPEGTKISANNDTTKNQQIFNH